MLSEEFLNSLNINHVVLTPKRIQTIMDNNTCSPLIWYNRKILEIKMDNDCEDEIGCTLSKRCVLCKFYQKIENGTKSIVPSNATEIDNSMRNTIML